MRVCYFGTYDETFPRNKALVQGLIENGVQVAVCHARLWSGTDDKISGVRGLQKKPLSPAFLRRVVGSYLRLLREHRRVDPYDVMLVGYAGHVDMLVAWVLSRLRRRPLAFDAVLSLHSTIVDERKLVEPGSIVARMFWLLDKVSCSLADLVFLDTQAHIDWFSERYDLPRGRFRRVLTGAEPLGPAEGEPRVDGGPFKVLYFGSFIPLHGVEHILGAARELRGEAGIEFHLVGDGQNYEKAQRLAQENNLSNVHFLRRIFRPSELATSFGNADVCLGHFGTSRVAERVIPQKIAISLAMGLPVLTRDSPAVREIFSPGQNIMVCQAGDPQSLAAALLALKADAALRQSIAREGHRFYWERLCPGAIGREAKEHLLALCQGR